MPTSVHDTLKNIFELWKKTYIPLLPYTVLTVFCFESSLLINNFIIGFLLLFPGLYLSNIILLKLSKASRREIVGDKEIYPLATARYLNSLLLFLGLGALFIFAILIASTLLGLVFGLIVALLLLVFYSYMIFSYPLVVIDNMTPINALKKSFRLINNHMWYITALFLIVGCVEGISYVVLYFIVGLKFTSLIYNLLYTTLNLALSVVVLDSLKQQAE